MPKVVIQAVLVKVADQVETFLKQPDQPLTCCIDGAVCVIKDAAHEAVTKLQGAPPEDVVQFVMDECGSNFGQDRDAALFAAFMIKEHLDDASQALQHGNMHGVRVRLLNFGRTYINMLGGRLCFASSTARGLLHDQDVDSESDEDTDSEGDSE